MLAAKINVNRLAAAAGRLAHRFRSAALDLLYPPTCIGCHVEMDSAPPAAFCDACVGRVGFFRGVTCLKCGAPVPGAKPSRTCARCGGAKLWFDETVALGEYDGLLREWLLRMKDNSGQPLALSVAELIWREHSERLVAAEADVVVPVPMHWRRRLRRRTNAPSLLAERTAGHLRLPLATDLLCRTRHTRPQFSVPRSRRRANVRNAFAVRSGYHVEGAHVLLVDDIMTTGSTCSAASRALRQAGAARVSVVVAARTLSH